MDEYKNLAASIIEQAIYDYYTLRIGLKKPAQNNNLNELQQFFRSGWFSLLTDIDSSVLIGEMENTISKSQLEYIVRRKGKKYYVTRIDEETPLTREYAVKANAVSKAAAMQDIPEWCYVALSSAYDRKKWVYHV